MEGCGASTSAQHFVISLELELNLLEEIDVFLFLIEAFTT